MFLREPYGSRMCSAGGNSVGGHEWRASEGVDRWAQQRVTRFTLHDPIVGWEDPRAIDEWMRAATLLHRACMGASSSVSYERAQHAGSSSNSNRTPHLLPLARALTCSESCHDAAGARRGRGRETHKCDVMSTHTSHTRELRDAATPNRRRDETCSRAERGDQQSGSKQAAGTRNTQEDAHTATIKQIRERDRQRPTSDRNLRRSQIPVRLKQGDTSGVPLSRSFLVASRASAPHCSRCELVQSASLCDAAVSVREVSELLICVCSPLDPAAVDTGE